MTLKIGLEVHGYLRTKQKLFCNCAIDRDSKPNTNICPRCTGQPGAKPMLPNKHAVEKIIKAGLMLDCNIQKNLIFQRKHYSWPDMPSGYQRTMSGSYGQPVGIGGKFLGIDITQVHLEEDPAKWDPITGLIDYNRAGYPLIEIVTEPDFTNAQQVGQWLKKLLTTLSYIDAVEPNAGIKCDVNVNIPGHPRVEIKNVNSIKAIMLAIECEEKRQHEVMAKGEKCTQHTRTPPDEQGITKMMRSKEQAMDYMFIPDTDLPVIELSNNDIKKLEKTLPEKPHIKKKKFLMLTDAINAEIISSDIVLAELFERLSKVIPPKDAVRWLRHELLAALHATHCEISSLDFDRFIELVLMTKNNKITDAVAIDLLEKLVVASFDVKEYVQKNKLGAVSDSIELKQFCVDAIKNSPIAVKEYKAGKEKAINNIVGKVMAASQGKAKPDIVVKMIKELIR